MTGKRELVDGSRHAFVKAYQRAANRKLHRELRIFGWRLLHAALPVGASKVAFLQPGHVQQLLEQACQHPVCLTQQQPAVAQTTGAQQQPAAAQQPLTTQQQPTQQQPTAGQATHRQLPAATQEAPPLQHPAQSPATPPLETLTHVFLECPVAARSMRWFKQLWARIQPGAAVPLTPQVMLQDDTSTFKPAQELAFLWTFLRLLMLKSLWDTRNQRAGQPSHTAQAVVCRFVKSLQQQVTRDWQRVMTDIRWEAGVPASWFRGRDPQLEQEEFKAKWCVRGVIATGGAHPVHGAAALTFHLTAAGV